MNSLNSQTHLGSSISNEDALAQAKKSKEVVASLMKILIKFHENVARNRFANQYEEELKRLEQTRDTLSRYSKTEKYRIYIEKSSAVQREEFTKVDSIYRATVAAKKDGVARADLTRFEEQVRLEHEHLSRLKQFKMDIDINHDLHHGVAPEPVSQDLIHSIQNLESKVKLIRHEITERKAYMKLEWIKLVSELEELGNKVGSVRNYLDIIDDSKPLFDLQKKLEFNNPNPSLGTEKSFQLEVSHEATQDSGKRLKINKRLSKNPQTGKLYLDGQEYVLVGGEEYIFNLEQDFTASDEIYRSTAPMREFHRENHMWFELSYLHKYPNQDLISNEKGLDSRFRAYGKFEGKYTQQWAIGNGWILERVQGVLAEDIED